MVQNVQTFPESHCHLFHYLSIIFSGFNNDVALDGMVINLASLLARTVTNPFENGYFQGPKEAPLEVVFVCPGFFDPVWVRHDSNEVQDRRIGSARHVAEREKRGMGGRKRKKLIKNCNNLLEHSQQEWCNCYNTILATKIPKYKNANYNKGANIKKYLKNNNNN